MLTARRLRERLEGKVPAIPQPTPPPIITMEDHNLAVKEILKSHGITAEDEHIQELTKKAKDKDAKEAADLLNKHPELRREADEVPTPAALGAEINPRASAYVPPWPTASVDSPVLNPPGTPPSVDAPKAPAKNVPAPQQPSTANTAAPIEPDKGKRR